MSNQSAGTSFHMENFKRRSRYAMVFILLILAFGLITVLNINTGNVHISLSEIIDILLKKPQIQKNTASSGKSVFPGS